MRTCRALVVDDSAFYRCLVSDILSELPGVTVVGTARNGKVAIEKVAALKPDLMTLDQAMPEMDGLAALTELRQQAEPPGVIMLSAFTSQGAEATMKALRLGALDFVLKPSGPDRNANVGRLRQDLGGKIDAWWRGGGHGRCRGVEPVLNQPPAVRRPPAGPVKTPAAPPSKIDAVAIGISTGGPLALTMVLTELPGDLNAPVLVVQHMPPLFTRSLARDLNRSCALRVSEAADGQLVTPGEVLIAPGGKQMRVIGRPEQARIRITDDPPENSCRPSVDYLFRSVAKVYGQRTLAVIMTGMGSDGTAGCRVLKEQGATIFAQDEESCVVFGMPKEPIAQGLCDQVLPLDRIAGEIIAAVGRKPTAVPALAAR